MEAPEGDWLAPPVVKAGGKGQSWDHSPPVVTSSWPSPPVPQVWVSLPASFLRFSSSTDEENATVRSQREHSTGFSVGSPSLTCHTGSPTFCSQFCSTPDFEWLGWCSKSYYCHHIKCQKWVSCLMAEGKPGHPPLKTKHLPETVQGRCS